MHQYVCLDCGWIYDEATGLPEKGIPAGTRWEDIPNDFVCPNCSVKKSDTHMWQQL
jgi:rubredoxin